MMVTVKGYELVTYLEKVKEECSMSKEQPAALLKIPVL